MLKVDRRYLLINAAVFTGAAALGAACSHAQGTSNPTPTRGPFTLDPLPYAMDKNEPYVDAAWQDARS
jgi:hypothetical protein